MNPALTLETLSLFCPSNTFARRVRIRDGTNLHKSLQLDKALQIRCKHQHERLVRKRLANRAPILHLGTGVQGARTKRQVNKI